MHLSAGQGPLECCLFVSKLVSFILEECKQRGIVFNIIEKVPGEIPKSFSSVVISLEGNGAQNLAQKWQGTMQWIYKSPARKKNYRKNWFVGIQLIRNENKLSPLFDEKEVKFEYMRASGPGGQHVNKTKSAVRAIHQPTGLITIAKQERSQHQNKHAALIQLREKLMTMEERKQDNFNIKKWSNNITLERGNAKMVFYGEHCQPGDEKSINIKS